MSVKHISYYVKLLKIKVKMKSKTSLLYSQRSKLNSIYWKLVNLRNQFEDSDLLLNYGNGSVMEQLDVAIAALECIGQEYPF